jgi:hypothetical protein
MRPDLPVRIANMTNGYGVLVFRLTVVPPAVGGRSLTEVYVADRGGGPVVPDCRTSLAVAQSGGLEYRYF